MECKRLGNLEQWGSVLEQLDEWKRAGQLDRHQADLLWLLRFRGNWRLREAALEMMASLKAPDPELIREACNILTDENLYQEVRILAAESVAAMLSSEGGSGAPLVGPAGKARECMHALLGSPQPPVLHLALRRALSQLQ
ncbi:MAG: hypothetical protein FJ276_00940 [Planctomycetes bacterium]|nr:hypothetical protein [Planctomycetota bacterium]